MISYRVAYRLDMGTFFAEVPDFPEASSLGLSLTDARHNVLQALTSAVERAMRRGDMLPIPDVSRNLGEVYLVENILLLPVDSERVEARVVN